MHTNNTKAIALLNTVDYDKKIAYYAAFGFALLEKSKRISDYIEGKDGNQKHFKFHLVNLAYKINEEVVLDIDLFVDVLVKVINSKKNAFGNDYALIDSNGSFDGYLGIGNILGTYLEIITGRFSDTKDMYAALIRSDYLNGA